MVHSALKSSYLFIRNLDCVRDMCRFTLGRLGYKGLAKFMSDMCEAAGIPQRTNHALRQTAITNMYIGGIAEREIMLLSRHRSNEALQSYME